MSKDKLLKLMKTLENSGFPASERQLEQFLSYFDFLVTKNKVMNLTAITDYDEVLEKHFLDSLQLLRWEGFQTGGSLIDVGTGAGFPGIPLKIMAPELKLTLLDSLDKRVGFLRETAEILGLSDVNAVHLRAEQGGKNAEYRETFDYAVTRAVAPLSVVLELCVPFLKVGGVCAAYKGPKAGEELSKSSRAMKELSVELIEVQKADLPLSRDERNLVLFRKTAETKDKYPRRDGIPAKRPL